MRAGSGRSHPSHGPSPWQFARQVTAGVLRHECMGSAAMIAYYMLFAIFPLLLSVTSLLAFLPIPNPIHWLLRLLDAVMPSEALALMRDSVERAVTRQHSGLFSISLLVTVWAAANAVE